MNNNCVQRSSWSSCCWCWEEIGDDDGESLTSLCWRNPKGIKYYEVESSVILCQNLSKTQCERNGKWTPQRKTLTHQHLRIFEMSPQSTAQSTVAAAATKSTPTSLATIHSHLDNEGSLLLLFIYNDIDLRWHRQSRLFVTISLSSHAMPFISAGGVRTITGTTT